MTKPTKVNIEKKQVQKIFLISFYLTTIISYIYASQQEYLAKLIEPMYGNYFPFYLRKEISNLSIVLGIMIGYKVSFNVHFESTIRRLSMLLIASPIIANYINQKSVLLGIIWGPQLYNFVLIYYPVFSMSLLVSSFTTQIFIVGFTIPQKISIAISMFVNLAFGLGNSRIFQNPGYLNIFCTFSYLSAHNIIYSGLITLCSILIYQLITNFSGIQIRKYILPIISIYLAGYSFLKLSSCNMNYYVK